MYFVLLSEVSLFLFLFFEWDERERWFRSSSWRSIGPGFDPCWDLLFSLILLSLFSVSFLLSLLSLFLSSFFLSFLLSLEGSLAKSYSFLLLFFLLS